MNTVQSTTTASPEPTAHESLVLAVRTFFDSIPSSTLDRWKIPTAREAFDSQKPLWILPDGALIEAFGGHVTFFDFAGVFSGAECPDTSTSARTRPELLVESGIGYLSRQGEDLAHVIVGDEPSPEALRSVEEFCRLANASSCHLELQLKASRAVEDFLSSRGLRLKEQVETPRELQALSAFVAEIRRHMTRETAAGGREWALSADLLQNSFLVVEFSNTSRGSGHSTMGEILQAPPGVFWDPEGAQGYFKSSEKF